MSRNQSVKAPPVIIQQRPIGTFKIFQFCRYFCGHKIYLCKYIVKFQQDLKKISSPWGRQRFQLVMTGLRLSNQAGYKALVTKCLTGILAVGHFLFQEHFRRLPDTALAQRGHDDVLIAV